MRCSFAEPLQRKKRLPLSPVLPTQKFDQAVRSGASVGAAAPKNSGHELPRLASSAREGTAAARALEAADFEVQAALRGNTARTETGAVISEHQLHCQEVDREDLVSNGPQTLPPLLGRRRRSSLQEPKRLFIHPGGWPPAEVEMWQTVGGEWPTRDVSTEWLDSNPVIWRGDPEEKFADKLQDDHEFAHFRRETARRTGARHRQRAHECGKRKLKRELQVRRERRLAEKAAQTPISSDCAKDAALATDEMQGNGRQASFSRLIFETFNPRGPEDALTKGKSIRSSLALLGVSPTLPPVEGENSADNYVGDAVTDEDQAEEAKTSILSHLKHKHDKKDRISRIERLLKCRRSQGRMARLLEFRRRQFEQLPEEEQADLRKAFQRASQNLTDTLEPKQLRRALAELGLSPKTDTEKKEVRVICDEVAVLGDVDLLVFCFEAVPRTRAKLMEMRRGPLLQQFKMYDADDSGYLSEAECMQILDRLYTWNLDMEGLEMMRYSFSDALEQAQKLDEGVDFDGFESLMSTVQESYYRILHDRELAIVTEQDLQESEVREHWDELVGLYDSFVRASFGKDGINRTALRSLLIEYGMYPRDEKSQERVDAFFMDCDTHFKGLIGFKELLFVIRNVREVIRRGSQPELRKMFESFDRDGSGQLDLSEVSAMLLELGLTPRTREDQVEMKRLIEQVDDGDGDVNFSEFQTLVQRITERINADQRRRERQSALELAYTDAQVTELRDAFYALDTEGAGALTIEKLRRAVDLLRRPMSAEQLQALMSELDVSSVGALDFEQFMRFMKEVTKGA